MEDQALKRGSTISQIIGNPSFPWKRAADKTSVDADVDLPICVVDATYATLTRVRGVFPTWNPGTSANASFVLKLFRHGSMIRSLQVPMKDTWATKSAIVLSTLGWELQQNDVLTVGVSKTAVGYLMPSCLFLVDLAL